MKMKRFGYVGYMKSIYLDCWPKWAIWIKPWRISIFWGANCNEWCEPVWDHSWKFPK